MFTKEQLQVPVAFFIYNRPSLTSRVFEAIAKVRPLKLLVVADGQSIGRANDAEKCMAARAVIERVDWKCEVIKNYSDTNLGCRKRVSSGLDWVFNNEEEAIILEDDCLPDTSFFFFCQELLRKYRDNERVMLVAGYNSLGKWKNDLQGYHFSYYGDIWGWASWRRAWKHYDVNMKLWADPKIKEKIKETFVIKEFFDLQSKYFNDVYAGEIDTWDFQWFFTRLLCSGLSIVPSVNLIRNIGFGQDAVHTDNAFDARRGMSLHAMKFPLKDPDNFAEDEEFAKKYYLKALEHAKEKITLAHRFLRKSTRIVKSFLRYLYYKIKSGGFFFHKHIYSYFEDNLEREAYKSIRVIKDYTMVEPLRLMSLYEQIVFCEKYKIPGSFVECGTWKGGCVGLFALGNLKHGLKRRDLHLFDSFEGAPEPDEKIDGERAVQQILSVGGQTKGKLRAIKGVYEKYASGVGTLAINKHLLEEVIRYDSAFIHYHKGWFQNTLPKDAPEIGPIAILRLDCDWYASTKICLEYLYGKVASGGFVIIDDYGYYEGCKKAVNEFIETNKIKVFINRIDAAGRYIINP